MGSAGWFGTAAGLLVSREDLRLRKFMGLYGFLCYWFLGFLILFGYLRFFTTGAGFFICGVSGWSLISGFLSEEAVLLRVLFISVIMGKFKLRLLCAVRGFKSLSVICSCLSVTVTVCCTGEYTGCWAGKWICCIGDWVCRTGADAGCWFWAGILVCTEVWGVDEDAELFSEIKSG